MPAIARRVQRREFKDYQPMLMLINSLDIIDEATRRDFMCVVGPIWQRYNAATKGARQRRITAYFLGDDTNSFDELLYIGCDWVSRRQHQWRTLWAGHPLCERLSEEAVRHFCVGLEGRSVLTLSGLLPVLQPAHTVDMADGAGCDPHWPGSLAGTMPTTAQAA